MTEREDIDVAYVATLARLALTPEETGRFGAQLGALLSHVAALSELDLNDVSPTAGIVTSRNVARPDDLRPCLARETVLSAAPERDGAFFRVPRIIAPEGPLDAGPSGGDVIAGESYEPS